MIPNTTDLLFSGLTYKKLNRLDEALDSFLKLHAILRNSAQVLFQIAGMYLFEKCKSDASYFLYIVVYLYIVVQYCSGNVEDSQVEIICHVSSGHWVDRSGKYRVNIGTLACNGCGI